ncbi:glutamate--cysteine ligase [Micromonospora pattaloongensis]|uniref:Glutamate--cysteine ligase EgtA n=1 Tax=Micromonospora pattaloongensis TaxID=405436 RepID=A0A1H3NRP6_9ACTN|nr:ergothioneine biosynthesis glutamate--cysteine ligase EgtA [Micromonospora pattaloongensis]SDY91596.1 glutamate--cysteine ligase [Micromonospora pattaloongensis]
MTVSRQRPVAQQHPTADRHPTVRSVDEAEAYVASICFKTGPPRLIGVEMEWVAHARDDPGRPIDPTVLRAALGPHAPRTLDPDSPHAPLPGGATVTVEPGGQVELSTPPHASLDALRVTTAADLDRLTRRLADAGLALHPGGIDPHRRCSRLLSTPRYDAMATAFARDGRDGLVMMCSTAALQVCLDAGTPAQLAPRWAVAHALGPVLLATFATSPRHAGRDTGWASARMRAWLRMRPERTSPVEVTDDPADAWARYALRAPLLCVRRPNGGWHAPPDVSFADWIRGALPRPPTTDDLDYHLSTLFPPVRPRGYLELRYLDSQPPAAWLAPVAVLAAATATDATVDTVRDLAAPAADRWVDAARHGLAAPLLAATARQVLDVACRGLAHTDLPPAVRDEVAVTVERRLAGAPGREFHP